MSADYSNPKSPRHPMPDFVKQALQESETRFRTLAFQRRQLLNELDHRVKNTLAVVQSVADLTFAASSSLDGSAAGRIG